MDTNGGGWLGVAALAVTVGNWAVYWPKIKAMRIALRPVGHQAVMVVALLLAGVAFVRGPGLLGGICAGVAMLGAGMLLFFTLNSTMPKNVPAVAVGQPILDFTATDAAGGEFTLSSLAGTPYLLKFFRGHW